ncbi:MAG: acetyltransferase, ribosomal protein N-acetylase [Bacteroidetes bacterium]|nr:acetyltransferase, ribosomal protein N-acetylase [Bacteroidota bacterium]
MKLKGQMVTLRALEPEDIDVLYNWENDPENWAVSNTQTPFSRFVLEQYITTAHVDIYSAKQLRLMICDKEGKAVGSIDLFDFEPNHLRAGVGILVADKTDRRKGYASEALELLRNYCFDILNLHQIYCNITTDNESSILLFQKHGFQITGIKKQWIRSGSGYKDELLLQLIR